MHGDASLLCMGERGGGRGLYFILVLDLAEYHDAIHITQEFVSYCEEILTQCGLIRLLQV